MTTKKKKKSSTRVPTTVRLPDDLREEIEEVAQEQESNPSIVLRQILRNWSRKRKNPDLETEGQGN